MPLPHFLRHFFCYDPFPDMLPRRERRKPSLMYFIPIADFNPRSREGSDQWLPILFVHSKISIHAPARGATEVFRITPSMKLFQSTLPRGERRSRRQRLFEIARISIHAPASGATVTMVRMAKMVKISIHAPASGATLEVVEVVRRRVFQSTLPRVERRATSTWSCCRRVFQSTLPRVERRGKIYVVCSRGAISIHAPASGATVIFPLSSCSVTFQSTLPRVERPSWELRSRRTKRFQSTLPRVERRYKNVHTLFRHNISIHAPASGATKF